MGLSNFLLTCIIVALVVLVIILIGIGIIRFIDYLEENPYGSKAAIEKIIFGVYASHVLLLFLGVSLWQILFSLSIQYSYHCLLDSHAEIETSDSRFIYGLVASLINYFLMIRFISMHNTALVYVIPCFLVIWITPVCFFFSMSATEDAPFKKPRRGESKSYGKKILNYLMTLGKKDTVMKE